MSYELDSNALERFHESKLDVLTSSGSMWPDFSKLNNVSGKTVNEIVLWQAQADLHWF